MSLPTAAQLQDRQAVAEEKIKKLEESYQRFLRDFESLEKEEQVILARAKTVVDAGKIHNLLNKISNFKDY